MIIALLANCLRDVGDPISCCSLRPTLCIGVRCARSFYIHSIVGSELKSQQGADLCFYDLYPWLYHAVKAQSCRIPHLNPHRPRLL